LPNFFFVESKGISVFAASNSDAGIY